MQKKQSKDKLDIILDAAQKRFGHYGLSKTTMNEIADDAGMSKASLYYYFKDKESIFSAVAEKEQLHFEEEMSKLAGSTNRAEFMLTGYIELRLDLIKKLLTLGKFSYSNYMEVKPILTTLFKDFKKREIEMISGILQIGVEHKEFVIENIKVHAELFVDALRGLRHAAFFGYSSGESVMPPKEYQKLRVQSRMFTDLFIKGIALTKQK